MFFTESFKRHRSSKLCRSSARLIIGSTFHYIAALTRSQELGFQKPTRARMEALRRRWWHNTRAFLDEIFLTPPSLLAVLDNAAHWGPEASVNISSGLARVSGGSVPTNSGRVVPDNAPGFVPNKSKARRPRTSKPIVAVSRDDEKKFLEMCCVRSWQEIFS